jgi:hypothetical protein
MWKTPHFHRGYCGNVERFVDKEHVLLGKTGKICPFVDKIFE